MKALTISQPFASLIASGEKFVENRTWETKYRGPLAIHAGRGTQYLNRKQLDSYPTGGIIAIANLVACLMRDMILRNDLDTNMRKRLIPGTSLNWSEVARHKHAEGPWCWILADVKPVEFFRISGAQGLWQFGGIPPIIN